MDRKQALLGWISLPFFFCYLSFLRVHGFRAAFVGPTRLGHYSMYTVTNLMVVSPYGSFFFHMVTLTCIIGLILPPMDHLRGI